MRIKLFPLIAVCALLMTSCTDYQSEIDKLKSEIDQTSEVLESLDVVSANLGALRDVMAFVQTGDYIESIVPSGKDIRLLSKITAVSLSGAIQPVSQ